MLGSIYEPDQIRSDTRKQAEQRGGTFIENAAVHIDPLRQSVTLADNSTISYDVLSCNTGSHVSKPHEREDRVIPVKPISGLIQARRFQRIVKRCLAKTGCNCDRRKLYGYGRSRFSLNRSKKNPA